MSKKKKKRRIEIQSLDETTAEQGADLLDGDEIGEDAIEDEADLEEVENDDYDGDAEEPEEAEEEDQLSQDASQEQDLRDADFEALDRADASAGADPVELAEHKAQARENREKYLRALADLENYKKRALKERSDLLKYQGEKVLYDMVEIIDDLERALDHADTDREQFQSGIEMILKKFIDSVGKWGVKGESGVGQRFDPNKQNALSKIVLEGAEPGTVINELKKAYFYKDKLLRPGEVVVAAAPPVAEPENQAAANEDQVDLDTGFEQEKLQKGSSYEEDSADLSENIEEND